MRIEQVVGLPVMAGISGQEAVVVNLDLPDVEPNPQRVDWVDDIHHSP